MLRKDRSRPAVTALRQEISAMESLVPDALRADFLAEAWAIQDRHKISFYDALLVASALAAGCTMFVSEDLNNGQKIETLTIVNPFITAPEAVLGA
jgi:predicted nucleic acid-binding protein